MVLFLMNASAFQHFEEDFVLRQNIKASDHQEMQCPELLVLVLSNKIQKRKKHAFASDTYLVNFNVAYITLSGISSEFNKENEIVHNVHDAHNDKQHGLVFFKCSCPAQQSIYPVCERCFASQN